ncbi:antitoxin of toxin-antitoxin stability system [Companilactobacillus ginsenosidimutans]|uniref:Antitoxin of toxin-antitoxin stability system n=2 Tax=Companilactobacillus ginsenosidimutans TaxID=1007676 RepID=A0A0H4QNS4_9LACO|nr:antitoxin of toxin-antitoxin stability system [Companilactobacillus ginsenosidimutans]
MTVKIRKVGNSNTLTVPNNIEPLAEEYDVFQSREGLIIYSPVGPNPFDDEEFIEKYKHQEKDLFGGYLVGKELPD